MVNINDNRASKEGVAEEGDLIEMDDFLCLVVVANNWKHEHLKGKLAIVLLNCTPNDDRMVLANNYQELFEKGEYKIFAKRGTWEINVK